jgi:predicted DNA-binding protein YlxM (UPF0122 family)
MAFNSNNRDYSIVTNNELATLLSYFNKDYIMSVIDNSLNIIRNSNSGLISPSPNIIAAYDANLGVYKLNYPGNVEEINSVAFDIYNTIVNRLSSYYNLFIKTDGEDIHTVSYLTYEFLVSQFQVNIVNFFVSYILGNSKNLYNELNLMNMKKNKDISTLYSKKVFVDSSLGLVCANLEMVLENIFIRDITIYNIIDIIYGSSTENGMYLKRILQDKGDFFKVYFINYIKNPNNYPYIITMIKLGIQENAETMKVNITSDQQSSED